MFEKIWFPLIHYALDIYHIFLLLCSGIVIAYIFAGRNFIGKELAELLVTFPLILPHAVIVYLLVILIGSNGFLGQLIYNFFGSRFKSRGLR